MCNFNTKMVALLVGSIAIAAMFGCEMTDAATMRRAPANDGISHWDIPDAQLAPRDLNPSKPGTLLERAPFDLTPVTSEREDATVLPPLGYDVNGTDPLPLVVFLHGYNGNAVYHAIPVGILNEFYANRNFVIMLPEGTENEKGSQYWEAGDNCCDYFGDNPGDEQWLLGQIELAKSDYRIDRVYLYGVSNGGFMSYHMACNNADVIDGVVSFAGMLYDDTDACQPSEPVSVLHIHGTADSFVYYDGLTGDAPEPLLAGYPGAVETVDVWRDRNDCDPSSSTLENLDLEDDIEGNETTRETWSCNGSEVALWSTQGGEHNPNFNTSEFGARTLDWLLAQ